MSAEPGKSVVFAAKRTLRFQSPPHERPAPPEVLLLSEPPGNEGERETWRFPVIGEFEHSAKSESWTDGTRIVRLESRFEPPDMPGRDFMWTCLDFARDISRAILHPRVLPAIRRFDGPLLDQILARVEALADSATLSGDDVMSSNSDYVNAQARADSVTRALANASGAPPPLSGEGLPGYKSRLLEPLKKYSAKCKNVDLSKVGDPHAFAALEDAILADAAAEAARPISVSLRPDELVAVVSHDAAGRPITRYRAGSDGALWDKFNPAIRYARRFLAPGVSRV